MFDKHDIKDNRHIWSTFNYKVSWKNINILKLLKLVTATRYYPVYFTIYTYLHQLFAMFSGRLQHLPEFKFPASTTHRLPPLKYKPRFQFFSGSHAMSSAKWSWYFTTILEYIKWFLVEKIRFFSEAETFIYPFYRLFYLDYVYITWCQRISNFV